MTRRQCSLKCSPHWCVAPHKHIVSRSGEAFCPQKMWTPWCPEIPVDSGKSMSPVLSQFHRSAVSLSAVLCLILTGQNRCAPGLFVLMSGAGSCLSGGYLTQGCLTRHELWRMNKMHVCPVKGFLVILKFSCSGSNYTIIHRSIHPCKQ